MARLKVRFEWLTGLKQPIFRNVRLVGSWDRHGRYSNHRRTIAMKEFTAPDGCPAWRADVMLDNGQRGWTFRWSVLVDTQHRKGASGIPTEVGDPNSSAQYRSFELRADGQLERYWFTHCRRLGANKLWLEGKKKPALQFSVWAPNAREVAAVIGDPATGYIWSNGRGVKHAFRLKKRADGSGIWESDPADPALADFVRWDHQLYMFRIRKDDGSVVYRTDLYSRCQIGSGREKPENPRAGEAPWNHTRQDTASKRRIASIECDCADSASPRESGRMQFSGATTSGRSANDHYNRRRLEGANGRAERTTQSCWLRPGDLISTGGSYGVRCVICQTVPSGSSI